MFYVLFTGRAILSTFVRPVVCQPENSLKAIFRIHRCTPTPPAPRLTTYTSAPRELGWRIASPSAPHIPIPIISPPPHPPRIVRAVNKLSSLPFHLRLVFGQKRCPLFPIGLATCRAMPISTCERNQPWWQCALMCLGAMVWPTLCLLCSGCGLATAETSVASPMQAPIFATCPSYIAADVTVTQSISTDISFDPVCLRVSTIGYVRISSAGRTFIRTLAPLTPQSSALTVMVLMLEHTQQLVCAKVVLSVAPKAAFSGRFARYPRKHPARAHKKVSSCTFPHPLASSPLWADPFVHTVLPCHHCLGYFVHGSTDHSADCQVKCDGTQSGRRTSALIHYKYSLVGGLLTYLF